MKNTNTNPTAAFTAAAATAALRREVEEHREAADYHSQTAALWAKYAACQDHDIAAAEQAVRSAADRLRSARAKKADWLRRVAIEQADSEDARSLSDRAQARLDAATEARPF